MKKLILILFLGFELTSVGQSIKIATWNIEHFKTGAQRGFPEYNGKEPNKGPTYSGRDSSNFQYMANLINANNLKILALQEINGRTGNTLREIKPNYSRELEIFLPYLGPTWNYVIGSTGGSQRLAFLYDTLHAQLIDVCEFELENVKVQKKGLYDRQPLIGFFHFKENGKIMNDVVLVNIHLASGQQNDKNHNQAMNGIVDEINFYQLSDFGCLPSNEKDIIILGDLNANRFEKPFELFWDELENNGWDVLADNKSEYSPTRLSGVPLGFRKSRIDYIIISQGLVNKEVLVKTGIVMKELATAPDDFRRNASDHVPVYIPINIVQDND